MGDERPIHSAKRPFRAPTLDDVTTRVSTQMADSGRAVYLKLVDRITGEEQRFEWPPTADGHLLPWKTGQLEDAGPDDFPEGGARVMGLGHTVDAGNAEAGNADAGNADASAAPRALGDAGLD